MKVVLKLKRNMMKCIRSKSVLMPVRMDRHLLFNGDAIQLLDQMILDGEKVDMIFSDPPYKITARGNGGSTGGMFQNKMVNSGKVFKTNDLEIEDWLPRFYKVLKDNTHCYIMTNNKNITHYLEYIAKSDFHFIKCLVWVKDNKITGQTYMSQFEYIIMLRKGAHRRINDCGTSDVLHIPNKKLKDQEGNVIHFTEKPVALTNVLISNSTDVHDTVFDPFMGIAGCGVSAVELNRTFIGCELEEGFFNYGVERMKHAKRRKER